MKPFSFVELLNEARLFMAGSIYFDETNFLIRDLLLIAIPSIQNEISQNIIRITAPELEHETSRHDEYVLQALEEYFKFFFSASMKDVLVLEKDKDDEVFYSYKGVIQDPVLERALGVDLVFRLLYDPIYDAYRRENTKNGIIAFKTSEVLTFCTGIHTNNIKKIDFAKSSLESEMSQS